MCCPSNVLATQPRAIGRGWPLPSLLTSMMWSPRNYITSDHSLVPSTATFAQRGRPLPGLISAMYMNPLIPWASGLHARLLRCRHLRPHLPIAITHAWTDWTTSPRHACLPARHSTTGTTLSRSTSPVHGQGRRSRRCPSLPHLRRRLCRVHDDRERLRPDLSPIAAPRPRSPVWEWSTLRPTPRVLPRARRPFLLLLQCDGCALLPWVCRGSVTAPHQTLYCPPTH